MVTHTRPTMKSLPLCLGCGALLLLPVGGAEVHNIRKKQKHGGILHVYFDLETGEVLLASFSK